MPSLKAGFLDLNGLHFVSPPGPQTARLPRSEEEVAGITPILKVTALRMQQYFCGRTLADLEYLSNS